MTVLQLLKASYRLLVGAESPSAEELAHGLLCLNTLLSEWSTHRWGTYTVTNEGFTLTASDGTYSIGSGADFDTTRPVRILSAFIRNGSTDYPVRIVSRGKYQGRDDKTLTWIPFELYYEPSYPNGAIYLYPEPDSTYTLYLDSQKQLSAYAATSVSLNLPPEYETALKFSTAIDWAPELSAPIPPSVAARAVESVRNMKRLHSQPVPGIDARPFHSAGRDYDITGDVHY